MSRGESEEKKELLKKLYEAAEIIREAENITQRYNIVKSKLMNKQTYTKIDDRFSTKVVNTFGKGCGCFTIFFILILIFMLYVLFKEENSADFMFGLVSVAFNIIVIVVVWIVIIRIRKSRHKKKDRLGMQRMHEMNQQIEANNAQVNAEAARINQEMQRIRQIADECLNWYPRNYCYSEAVNYFISAIENYRADNLKEAVNLYVEEQRYQEMSAKQDKMIRQQTINNVLTAANVFATLGTMGAVKENTKAVKENTEAVNVQGERIANAIRAQGDRIASAIGNIRHRK